MILSTSFAYSSVSFAAYYEAAGTQSVGPIGQAQLCGTSTTCVIGTETFDALSTLTLQGDVSTFGNNGLITGTFSGTGTIDPADQYGGAGGTGNYLAVGYNKTETVTLSQGVDFFGLWFSAADATNSLSFYQAGNPTPVFTFGAAEFQALVGSCPGTAFCGNPNANFLNANHGQQYAFLEFVSTGGSFNSITLSEGNTGTFEADNMTVGYISNPNPVGTGISTPEPSSLGLVILGAGMLWFGGLGIRRFTV